MEQKKREEALKKFKDLAVPILIYIAVIVLLFFCLNQFLEFKYKVEFLSSPCSVCCELNEGFSCGSNSCGSNVLPMFNLPDTINKEDPI